jgi:hypothetical protein
MNTNQNSQLEYSKLKDMFQYNLEHIKEATGLNLNITDFNFEDSIERFEEFSKKRIPNYHLEIELEKSDFPKINRILEETISEFGYFSIPDINHRILVPIDEHLRTEILEIISLFEIFAVKYISKDLSDSFMIFYNADSDLNNDKGFPEGKFSINVNGINLIERVVKIINVG